MASLRMGARIKQPDLMMKLSNLLYRGVTPFGPLLWQAEADTELTLSASPTSGPNSVKHGEFLLE